MIPNNRRIPRLFLNATLDSGVISLANDQAHYLRRVLRLKSGDSVIIFNGAGRECRATIESLARDNAALRVVASLEPLPESPLRLSLLQSLVKAEAMDMIVQKVTELGVHALIPVVTEYSVVKLDSDRAARRVAHWQKIAQSACEQSGRHRPPAISPPQPLTAALAGLRGDHVGFCLHPHAALELSVAVSPAKQAQRMALLVGPEGGLSAADLEDADRAGFARVTLGPRVLRAETAALAACTLAQTRWGDLSS